MNVVITGASKGFGRSLAEEFAAKGHNLFLCSRNETNLYRTVEELMRYYPDSQIKANAFDLSVKEQAIAFGQWVLGFDVPVDVLINNAGLFDPGSVHNEPDGTLEHMLQVNLLSAYHLTRTLIARMMARKSGHIFNMCSIASL